MLLEMIEVEGMESFSPEDGAAFWLELGAVISDEFLEAVKQVANRLKIDHRWLLAVMDHESNIRPDIKNKVSNATGLIQFLPSTAKALGTDVETLARMSSVEQLKWVEKYLKQWTPLRTATDVAAAVFYPKARGNAGMIIGKTGQKTYEWNKALDRERKGFITMVDYMRSLWKFGKRWGVQMSDVDGYINSVLKAATFADLINLAQKILVENPKSSEAQAAFSKFTETLAKAAAGAGGAGAPPVWKDVDYRRLAESKIRGVFRIQSDFSPTLTDYKDAIVQTAVDVADNTVKTVESASIWSGPALAGLGVIVLAGVFMRVRGK